MADTPAERQRRYRAHKRGDHTLCDPERCVTETPSVTRNAASPEGGRGALRPPRLEARGRRLWQQMTEGVGLSPAELVLVEEACRIADRLERLDAVLAGDSDRWLAFTINDDGSEVVVVIDKALSEARQQAVSLKQLLGELRQMRGAAAGLAGAAAAPRAAPGAAPAPPPAGSSAGSSGGRDVGGVADLAARIAAKRGGQAAG